MTTAGQIVELARYRIPAGERALQAQRIDGRVAVTDVPVDHDDRVYLVERHVNSQADLDGLTAEYTAHSQTLGRPAAIANRWRDGGVAHGTGLRPALERAAAVTPANEPGPTLIAGRA